MDAAMLYENFSPVVFLLLEAHGFCGRGEAKDFIADGQIDIDGTLPVNTHGGLLGEAYIHGVNSIQEGVRQLRGTAANQAERVDHVLVSAGPSGLILGRV
jgi:acetyl-CoA acetyltransferase